MKREKLDKDLLLQLIAGNPDDRVTSKIIETEEVKAMMNDQWENPQEVVSNESPDFEQLFANIVNKNSKNEAGFLTNNNLLNKELDELKIRNIQLKRRIIFISGVAAAILIMLFAGSITFIKTNKIFQKSFTQNIAPKGQKSQVIMPDGTMAFLNSGTILKYDNSFGKRNRFVELVGEAYFEVSHNKELPFIIRANEVEIEVVGTKFNVMAYPDEEYVETTVTEGKVNVRDIAGTSSLFLTANQKATYHKPTKVLSLKDVNSDPSVSWKDNVLSFDNENFNDVIKKLERWYNISIIVEGKDSLEDRFTLTIRHESLKEVLDLISLTTRFEYAINNDQVKITYNK
jgi:transmembrane sensor